ncbi:hypothetical protein MPL3356_70302 [Mesorhizobium plurifarium]|uniref:Uncharacterized protein n=1 Tax=Mesorhizobium plurifarium TaxID=69974 RepID=A0A090GW50_MESPL|nr:hypothetical protein MPL3356_70302 [Mesorhizobium plurifarium]CDX62356.1 hypothetical protein MPL3365_70421 [Mesorhizobium plurifarium]
MPAPHGFLIVGENLWAVNECGGTSAGHAQVTVTLEPIVHPLVTLCLR